MQFYGPVDGFTSLSLRAIDTSARRSPPASPLIATAGVSTDPAVVTLVPGAIQRRRSPPSPVALPRRCRPRTPGSVSLTKPLDGGRSRPSHCYRGRSGRHRGGQVRVAALHQLVQDPRGDGAALGTLHDVPGRWTIQHETPTGLGAVSIGRIPRRAARAPLSPRPFSSLTVRVGLSPPWSEPFNRHSRFPQPPGRRGQGRGAPPRKWFQDSRDAPTDRRHAHPAITPTFQKPRGPPAQASPWGRRNNQPGE